MGWLARMRLFKNVGRFQWRFTLEKIACGMQLSDGIKI